MTIAERRSVREEFLAGLFQDDRRIDGPTLQARLGMLAVRQAEHEEGLAEHNRRLLIMEQWVKSCEGVEAHWVQPLEKQAKRIDARLSEIVALDDRVEALESRPAQLAQAVPQEDAETVNVHYGATPVECPKPVTVVTAEADGTDGEDCSNCGGPLARCNGWVCEDCGDTFADATEVDKQEPVTVATVGQHSTIGPVGEALLSENRNKFFAKHDAEATVATVGVKCPACNGECLVWVEIYPQPQAIQKTCPTCLGEGLLHTHAEYQALEADRDEHRRALQNASTWGSVAGGKVVDDSTVTALLAEAKAELAAEREEADTHE